MVIDLNLNFYRYKNLQNQEKIRYFERIEIILSLIEIVGFLADIYESRDICEKRLFKLELPDKS